MPSMISLGINEIEVLSDLEKVWTERGVPDDMAMRLIFGVAIGRLVRQGLTRDVAHAYMDSAFDVLQVSE